MKTIARPETETMETATVEPRGSLGLLLTLLWKQVRATTASVSITRRQRNLRLCESVSLGEKRMLAVVECDRQRFLIAATPQSISLLQSLGPVSDVETTRRQDEAQEKVQ